ncbi:oxidoreductase [Nocardioides aurantiacus]|uniref:oxidoreductase n=1 Tax=Nocardioides aurantiacus TaxID=86796 RepID=UPI00403FB021
MSTYDLGSLPVHRVGYGAMQLPGPGVMGPPRDRDEALAVLRRAVELGVDHVDTSQFYGPDVANELIHDALHPYPEDLVLVSKVGARRDAEGAWLPAQRPEELRRGVEDNLRTLDVERLGAVNLRLMDAGHDVPADQLVPLEDQLAEMAALRDEGKIAGVGLSNVTLEQVQAAVGATEVVCVQNPFSLVDQHDLDVLRFCAGLGIAYVPFFPLGSAFPGMPKVSEDPRVLAVAERRGVTPAQVGLAWLLALEENVLLIPGTSRVAHLEENLAVRDVELTEADLADLAG